jgi:hypothetical protein
MQRKEITILRNTVQQVGFINKIAVNLVSDVQSVMNSGRSEDSVRQGLEMINIT